MDSFAAKLSFAAKALSLSRGALGAELRVSKSVVSRWLSGARAPSSTNMAAITALVASRAPGFSVLDWDRDAEGLAAALGVAQGGRGAGGADDLTITLRPEIAAAARARAPDFEGLWRLTFSAGVKDSPEMFIHSYVLTRRGAGGLLGYRAGVFDMVLDGWAVTANNQFFGVAIDPTMGTISLVIFNSIAGARAEVVDGIILSCRDGLGGVPVAVACLAERVGDLSDDAAADDALFAALVAQHPMAPEGSVPAELRARLVGDVGPVAAAAGGDLLLIMPHLRSLAQGRAVADGA